MRSLRENKYGGGRKETGEWGPSRYGKKGELNTYGRKKIVENDCQRKEKQVGVLGQG